MSFIETRLVPPIQSAFIRGPPGPFGPRPYPFGCGPFMLPMPFVTYEGPPYEVCRPLYRDYPYDHHSLDDRCPGDSFNSNRNDCSNRNIDVTIKVEKNVCSHCNKVFKDKKSKKDHKKIHTTSKEKTSKKV
jgi:hypothetical protein